MADLKSALVFILQSIVVGLAVAFVVVLVRPDLLPVVQLSANDRPTSFADAVDQSAPSVATVYTKRLVQGNPDESGRSRFRIVTSAASASSPSGPRSGNCGFGRKVWKSGLRR